MPTTPKKPTPRKRKPVTVWAGVKVSGLFYRVRRNRVEFYDTTAPEFGWCKSSYTLPVFRVGVRAGKVLRPATAAELAHIAKLTKGGKA